VPSAKDFCNPMQIVKVDPLAKINAIFSERAGTGEYNIDGFDTREEGEGKDVRLKRGEEGSHPSLFIKSSLRNRKRVSCVELAEELKA